MGSKNQYDWYRLTGLTKEAIQLDMSFFLGQVIVTDALVLC